MEATPERIQELLERSLGAVENKEAVLNGIKNVLETRVPFALYVATADSSDCTWIFDAETVIDMAGGKQRYIDRLLSDEVFKLYPDENPCPMFIFKKTGPIYFLLLDAEILAKVLESLKNKP